MSETETATCQARALRTVLRLLDQHPTLPGAYLVFSRYAPTEAAIQLEGPSELEAWREALAVAPGDVQVRPLGDRAELRFWAHISGVKVYVYAIFDAATPEAGQAA